MTRYSPVSLRANCQCGENRSFAGVCLPEVEGWASCSLMQVYRPGNVNLVLVFPADIVGATLVVAQGRHKACPYKGHTAFRRSRGREYGRLKRSKLQLVSLEHLPRRPHAAERQLELAASECRLVHWYSLLLSR